MSESRTHLDVFLTTPVASLAVYIASAFCRLPSAFVHPRVKEKAWR